MEETLVNENGWGSQRISVEPENEVMEIKRRLAQSETEKDWATYSQDAPSVNEFNSSDWGKTPIIDNTEPEIYTLGLAEANDKILQEFQHAATIAGVKSIESTGIPVRFYGDDPFCPILNNPDEILIKIQEVFHSTEVALEKEDDTSDKHFILGYIQAKMPKRKLGWKDGCLHVDGARTNVSYQSIAASIMKKLRKVFG